MDFTEQSPAILSLCPGILGLDRGIKRVFPRARTVAYVEIETFIVENILSGMEAGLVDAAPIWTNLKTFNPWPFRDRIDGIIGGYPCQPFSIAGQGNGIYDPRHLWPYIEKCFIAIRPFWGFFENVSGHLEVGYREVSESLRNMGYRVESGIYTASEIGASHGRERLFILAVADSYDFGLSQSTVPTCSIPKRKICSDQSKIKSGIWGEADRCREFPAPPGLPRHSWEKSWVTESGMEHQINGYDFREDLHRAIGNSVVEQTAELAFIDLIQKHFPYWSPCRVRK